MAGEATRAHSGADIRASARASIGANADPTQAVVSDTYERPAPIPLPAFLRDPDSPMLDGLVSAIDDIAAAPAPRRRLRRIVVLVRAIRRLEALLARELAAFDVEGEFALYRSQSAPSWLARQVDMALGDARRLVRRARQVAKMPIIDRLWARGDIDTRCVDELASARQAARADEEFAILEERFADTAKRFGPKALVNDLRRWRDALDARRHDPADGDGQPWDGESLHLSELLDGVGVLNGRFGVENTALIQRALQQCLEKLRAAGDTRSPAEQRAHALAWICQFFLDHQHAGSNRPHILIHTDLETYLGLGVGLCETDRGHQVHPDVMRRIACDSLMQRVIFDANGVTLDLGRAVRTFTPDQYRAMSATYPTCVHPDCEVPTSRCQGHHIAWYTDDGPTDLANGVPLCWQHHRFVHELRWTITRDPHGTIRWLDPGGYPAGITTPRIRPQPFRTTDPPWPAPVPNPDVPNPDGTEHDLELIIAWPELGFGVLAAA